MCPLENQVANLLQSWVSDSTLGAVLHTISNNWITSRSSKTQNERFAEITAWSAWAHIASVSLGLKGMSIPLNAWGRRLVCFNFLAGYESGRLDMLAVGLVLKHAWFGVAELLPEGPYNCLKAVVAVVASAEAWIQGPLLPRIWVIKAAFPPLMCPAPLQAVANC